MQRRRKSKKLTQKQRQFVADWVFSKGGTPAKGCAVCGAVKWVVGEYIVAPVRLQGASVMLGGGSLYPLVPLICGNCGNTQFLNAVIMGLKEDGGES